MAFNPLLAESDFVHRVTVDRLKWQLGAPVPWPMLAPDWPLYYPARYCNSNNYYGYCDYPWTGAANYQQYHYSQGFRDGLSASQKSSGASSPSGARVESPTAAAAPAARDVKKAGNNSASDFPGDLMEFPSGSYRRPMCTYPVSNATSYDDLTQAWPYGCKPFYYRRADPPSVRFC